MKNNIYNKLKLEGKALPEKSIEDLQKKIDHAQLLEELDKITNPNLKRISNGPEGEQRWELTINRSNKKIKKDHNQVPSR
ncbi:MAG: hypothetical protein WBJ81_06965 [Rickettsiales bacterium]